MMPFALEFSLVAETEPPQGVSEDQLLEVCAFALTEEGAAGPWSITVALVDDGRLQAMHRDFMGIDTPTDIMTFPAEHDGPLIHSLTGQANAGPKERGGELVISVDHARTQASAWGLTPAEEVQFLVVHGVLHLLGWNDDDEATRERMLARQGEIFDRWRTGRFRAP